MIRTFKQQIGKAASQVRQAFLGLVARGGQQKLQLQGLDNEVLQDVDVMQQVGFVSWIPENAKVIMLPVGGKTGRAVIVGSTGGAVMVEVKKGETCIYDQFGNEFRLGKNGARTNCDLHVGGKITSDDDITSGGNVSDSKGSMQQIRVTYNIHKHGNTPPPDTPMA